MNNFIELTLIKQEISHLNIKHTAKHFKVNNKMLDMIKSGLCMYGTLLLSLKVTIITYKHYILNTVFKSLSLSLWKSIMFQKNWGDNDDDVHHDEGQADAESCVIQDARRSGVFLCNMLLSGRVSISGLLKSKCEV